MNLLLQGRDADVARLTCEGNMTVLPPTGQGDVFLQLLGPDCFKGTVFLNMARTGHVDSSGISWLLVAHNRFTEGGGRLVVHSVPTRVRGTFNLLRLSTVLHLATDEAEARGQVASH